MLGAFSGPLALPRSLNVQSFNYPSVSSSSFTPVGAKSPSFAATAQSDMNRSWGSVESVEGSLGCESLQKHAATYLGRGRNDAVGGGYAGGPISDVESEYDSRLLDDLEKSLLDENENDGDAADHGLHITDAADRSACDDHSAVCSGETSANYTTFYEKKKPGSGQNSSCKAKRSLKAATDKWADANNNDIMSGLEKSVQTTVQYNGQLRELHAQIAAMKDSHADILGTLIKELNDARNQLQVCQDD